MNILRWGRYMGDDIRFNETATYLSFGIRGSGKSTLLEHLGMNFMEKGSPILDLFGSRSGEALAWLRAPEAGGKKILLLHGDETSLACSYDAKPVSKYSLSDLEHYDLIISASPLYASIDAEYREINKIVDLVYKRAVWTRPVYMIVREAANLLYSRLKVSPDQTIAKSEMTYFVREARHSGFSLGLDTQKLSSIDIDIRITIDYLFFKSLGIQGLPQELHWLYNIYNPLKLQNMPQKNFLILTKTGSHGIGVFPFHKWHKQPGEDLLKDVGIEVEYGDELIESKDSHRVGDLLHAEIMKLRNSGDSYKLIADKKGISSATPYSHVVAHNKEVNSDGLCSRCERAKCDLAPLLIRQ